jgi:hypothetical protein
MTFPSPYKTLSFILGAHSGAQLTRFRQARSATSATVMLRCTERRVAAAIAVVSPDSLTARYGRNRIKHRDPDHDHVRGRSSLIEINTEGERQRARRS